MSNAPKTRFNGTVLRIDYRESERGTRWAVVTLDVAAGPRNERSEYEVKVFGVDRVNALRDYGEGAHVRVGCYVESRRFSGKLYLSLLLAEIKRDPTLDVAEVLKRGRK